jgi:nicotinate-nucleotide adenylyltransferase
MIRALLGGSFDPFHNGHLALVHHLLDGAWADRVVVVPAHRSPHKAHPVASGADRLTMARLALDGIAGVDVDSREVERGGISYTVDTLAEMSLASPGDQWRLVIGADNLSAFTTWRRWRRLLELADLLVVARAGFGIEVPTEVPEGVVVVTEFDSPVAATALRKSLAVGDLPRSEVPAAVLAYIQSGGLYGADQGRRRP